MISDALECVLRTAIVHGNATFTLASAIGDRVVVTLGYVGEGYTTRVFGDNDELITECGKLHDALEVHRRAIERAREVPT